jgi:hypothetical protein
MESVVGARASATRSIHPRSSSADWREWASTRGTSRPGMPMRGAPSVASATSYRVPTAGHRSSPGATCHDGNAATPGLGAIFVE